MKHVVALMSLVMLASVALADKSQELTETRVVFVSDATMFEGMFYSVLDYCRPFSGDAVAERTKADWLGKNKSLLRLRDQAMSQLLIKYAGDAEMADKMRAWQKDTFTSAHDSDREYADIRGSADMRTACSRRLGEFVSDSMTFERVAPKSFQYLLQSRVQKP